MVIVLDDVVEFEFRDVVRVDDFPNVADNIIPHEDHILQVGCYSLLQLLDGLECLCVLLIGLILPLSLSDG